jgi:hypothetical protein
MLGNQRKHGILAADLVLIVSFPYKTCDIYDT